MFKTLSLQKLITILLITNIFTLVVAESTFKINDPDTMHYLATGREMVSNGLFTNGSSGMCIFNYTDHTCQSVFFHEWLFHLMVYGVYIVGSWNGLVVFQIVIAVAIFVVILAHAKRSGRSLISTATFMLFAALVAVERFMLRADLFGLLMLVLFYSLVDEYIHRNIYQKKTKAKLPYLIAIFVTSFIWANTHGSFPLSFIITGSYIGASGLKGIWKKLTGYRGITEFYELKDLLFILLVSIAASFINPFGVKAVYGAFDFFFNGFADTLQKQNLEWQSPFKPSDFEHITIFVFKILFATSFVVLIGGITKLRLANLLLLIPITYLAVNYVRNIALFSLVTALILPYYTDVVIKTLNNVSAKIFKNIGLMIRYPITIGLIVFCLLMSWWNITDGINLYDNRSRRFGFGLSELSYPLGAVEFVKKNNLKANVFNDYASGTYINWLLYPTYKTFIDGDTFSLDILSYYNQIISGVIPYSQIVDKYHINYFLFQYSGYDSLGLIQKLYADPSWKLVYLDEVSCIFLANTQDNQGIINKYGIDLQTNRNFDPDNLVAVYEKINKSTGYSNRGLFLSNVSLHQKAQYQFEKAVLANPRDYVSLSNLGAAHSQVGNDELAADAYERSIAIQSRFAPSHFNLGLMYQKLKRYDEAIDQYKKSLAINSMYTLANFSIGSAYEAKGNIEMAKKYYQEEILIDPRNVQAQNALTRLQASPDSLNSPTNSSDLSSLLSQLQVTPNDPELHFKLGIAMGVSGNQEGAIEEFQQAIELKPDFALAHFNLGNAYSLQKLTEKAQIEYELTIKYDPKFPEAYLNLAIIYQGKGMNEKAVEKFQTYLQLNPNDPQAEEIKQQIYTLVKQKGVNPTP